ncbi:hybrid sensor histidine kinase/response regulator [Polyangium aurulentum]|uniref:hybrid sensor histidine kinase/response regulator n=1 Tax=Polyangium aurulentum TaxID=2567896 RepID=UPI0010AE8EFB|nr:hybrid sensor histidine kinase/response regulator [Polyangium aurulentum]UQA62434.1 response regulator [Polyangium aurulentum]
MGAKANATLASQALATFTEEALELLREIELSLNDLLGADEASRPKVFRDLLRLLHTLKGASAVVGQEDIRQYVHALEERVRNIKSGEEVLDAEATQQIAAGIEDVNFAVMELARESAAATKGGAQAGGEDVSPASIGPAQARGGELMRLKAEKVDAIHTLVGDLVVARLQYEGIARRMAALRDQATEASGVLRSLSTYVSGLRGALPARAHAELSARVAASSSLVSDLSRGMSATAGELPVLQAQATAVSTSIEEGIRDLRLMPLAAFFEDYAKVVRETARETGKEARLDVHAAGAEIDRAVLLRLRDALGHLVRNAVVHGLEPPAVRSGVGKSSCGVVRLEGHCERGRAVIKISDDGAGIDLARVRRVAVRAGLLRSEEPLREQALVEILTEPGFTTRDTADGLAGRGIGLDVVAGAVRELDGNLEISTTEGAGTVFTLSVPIKASTGLGLVVEVGEHAFGILLNHVDRAIRVGPEDVRTIESHDTVMVGEDPLAVVPLGSLVGIEGAHLPAHKAPGVVLRMGKQRLIVTVDDVPGDQALVVKPLGRAFAGASHLSGAAVQPDGSVLPVLHVPALFARAAGNGRARASQVAQSAPTPLRSKEELAVLVVDDSMTMRMLLRNILRSDRYEVAVAHDGKAALEVLASMPRCDLVVTDLQMPRMDGVELCRAIRRSTRGQMPVMVVTSVGDEEERRRALESGADAYLIKGELDQARFLEQVARLLGVEVSLP